MKTSVQEIPVQFECNSARLFGIVHKPEEAHNWGLVTIVAGGPQYRAGCGRQLALLARRASSAGIPVLRFDHRGLGDSEGEFLGFEHVRDDLTAAIAAFRSEVPGLENIVLYGGCDGGAAALMNAVDIDGVESVIAANPYVSSAEIKKSVERKHYLSRLKEASFWLKVIRFEYDFGSYLKAALRRVKNKIFRASPKSADHKQDDQAESELPFAERILITLQKFKGPILFIMSENSVTRREFDEFVSVYEEWQVACNRPDYVRIDIPRADQTFSTSEFREIFITSVVDWLVKLAAQKSH
jgi:exosortase A-associated hydrolase 1